MAVAAQKTDSLRYDLLRRGIDISFDDANALRRAAKTLQRWSEQECGDSDNYKSWAIERDEETEKPFMVIHPHTSGSKTIRYKIADREAGALKRVAEICKRNGLHFYHQSDPRGCPLFIGKEPMTMENYNNGIAICA